MILAALLTACNRDTPPTTSSAASNTPVSTQEITTAAPTTTAVPSPTAVPLAAVVNGGEITFAEYQSELALYQAAIQTELSPEDEQRVLNDLVEQAIFAQAASEEGFRVDDSMFQERIQRLIDQLGSEEALSDWMSEYQYDEQSFRKALARAISAAWMRDQIIASVPDTAEQVHAIQILLYDADEAGNVLAQLQAGNDFGNLALEYDPILGGELGWFPRGYLLDAQLEEAAFSLSPGEFSPVIETLAGYHILQVLEREPDRVLSPDALLALRARALEDWLEAQRADADIQILLP
jgi:parvulin-like peptidyl-prolyl isomerase